MNILDDPETITQMGQLFAGLGQLLHIYLVCMGVYYTSYALCIKDKNEKAERLIIHPAIGMFYTIAGFVIMVTLGAIGFYITTLTHPG